MPARRVAIAAGNEPGAAAAAEVARLGGNAVDACLTAAVMAWVAEPFLASLAGSGFIAVRTPDGDVEVFDGNNAMPERAPANAGEGLRRVWLENYANGMYTGIGGGSVAVPGVLAATHAAWERHGAVEWEALFQPAIAAARRGIHFPTTSAYYLSATWSEIWSVYPESRALFSSGGRPLRAGEPFVQPDLAEALSLVAREGPEAFFGGDVGRAVIDAIQHDGGAMSLEDLIAYGCEIRRPIATDAFGFHIEANPPPAVGGAVLVHMLSLLEDAPLDSPRERLRSVVQAERAAIGHRSESYEDPSEIAGALQEALRRMRKRGTGAASTTHTSTADSEGYACSLSESSGYGSGMVVRGMILNNTLGEEELNPGGVHGLPAGSRCHSNMTPTIATSDQRVIAIGSPGADRIVGAIAQAFMAVALDGASLREAVAAPRIHLSTKPDQDLLCFEPGLAGDELAREHGWVARPYEDVHMFFGAVQAASVSHDGEVDAAHDPRRSGGTAIV